MKDTGDLVFSNGKTLENFLVVNKVSGSPKGQEGLGSCQTWLKGVAELKMEEGNCDAWEMFLSQHHPYEFQTWLVFQMSGAALGGRQTSAGRN